MVNGKSYDNRSSLIMTGHRCVVNCEPEAIEEEEISDVALLWSEADSWPSGNVPVEGDEVEIEPSMNILFDIEDSPLLKSLTINGRLSFLNDPEIPQNLTLNVYWIYIRAGEFFIGDNLTAFNGNATVILYGETTEESLAFSIAVEGGNKMIAIVG